ncbi:MAG: prolipoprotein diacylglyceryl transferase [Verrucomicrobia bacterium]|nr:prolipoprotein diacylglyceryl transferase [Verrucomicrobiota bacterium]
MESLTSYYIHNIDPVIFHIHGPLALRWYGISYLLAFFAAYLILRSRSSKGLFDVPPGELQNFIVTLAFFGVLVGGRVGYLLFYGWADVQREPSYVFKVWEGGMASHGGMIGVILFVVWYARKHQHSFWNIMDNLALVAPIGLFFGRVANFINGELWGRVTTVPWGVIFPQEFGMGPCSGVAKDEIRWLIVDGALRPRHPSQLYEAFGEGLLLFALLCLLRKTKWAQKPGFLSVAFLVLYAAARISVEFVREPDSTIYFGWMTKGQLFSLMMLVVAAVTVVRMRIVSSDE